MLPASFARDRTGEVDLDRGPSVRVKWVAYSDRVSAWRAQFANASKGGKTEMLSRLVCFRSLPNEWLQI